MGSYSDIKLIYHTNWVHSQIFKVSFGYQDKDIDPSIKFGIIVNPCLAVGIS